MEKRINIGRYKEDVFVNIDGKEVEIYDSDGSDCIVAECELNDILSLTDEDFPEEFKIEVRSEDGFGTYLFHELLVGRDQDGFSLDYIFHQPNKYWEHRWGCATYISAIRDQTEHYESVTVAEIELEDEWKRLQLKVTPDKSGELKQTISRSTDILKRIVTNAEIALAGLNWKVDFEKNEKQFREEVLEPLLRRMGFKNVRHTHGVHEYGKDFTFSELTKFNSWRHYGLQAKAGNLSGGVNAQIDEIIGQLNDAFSMPFLSMDSKEKKYIHTFIVAISGRYTNNAKEKILEKIPQSSYGSVVFLDRESIQELIEQYWVRKH